jgi:hypothetical protein
MRTCGFARDIRRRLTVKLRGRSEAPDERRGRILSSRARDGATERHGPLQRLLDGALAATSLLQENGQLSSFLPGQFEWKNAGA